MRTLKITLAYDGTDYCGWQFQNDVPSVQAKLEDAIHRVTRERQRVIASGRTDAGVHAIGQVVGFRSNTQLSTHVLTRALNASLPFDIRVLKTEEAESSFHAIRDAVGKRYRYLLQDGGALDVFNRRFCAYVTRPLDFPAMCQAAAFLVGEHDFASFEADGSPRKSTVRHVRELTVQRIRREMSEPIQIEIEADGFLYKMVRNIVGTLIHVGQGKAPPNWAKEVLEARDRRAAGMTADATGLVLVNVDYGPSKAAIFPNDQRG